MFRVLRSEKLNESLQEKNYIPFPMASTYEKGEGNEYLWDIQYAPGIRGAVWFNTHRHPVKWVRGSQMLRQVVISGGCGHPGPASFICFGLCAQSCLTLWDPMDCSSPDSSVHGIFLARILEWVATSFSRGSSWPRDRTHIPYVLPHCKQVFYRWTTREALNDFNGVGIVEASPTGIPGDFNTEALGDRLGGRCHQAPFANEPTGA